MQFKIFCFENCIHNRKNKLQYQNVYEDIDLKRQFKTTLRQHEEDTTALIIGCDE